MPFVVLGVEQARLEEIVQKRVSRLERNLKKKPTPESTARRRQKVLTKIAAKPPVQPISAEFDAPQFAVDYAELAKKFGYRYLTVATKDAFPGGRTWITHEVQPSQERGAAA